MKPMRVPRPGFNSTVIGHRFFSNRDQMKTFEANVVKSLFAVLRKLSLNILPCHKRQTKPFFLQFFSSILWLYGIQQYMSSVVQIASQMA